MILTSTQVPILLSKYQILNEYSPSISICFSPTLHILSIPNLKMASLGGIFITRSISYSLSVQLAGTITIQILLVYLSFKKRRWIPPCTF